MRTLDLNPERWARLEKLFDAAIDMPPEQRDAYLQDACRDDPELRSYIHSLLDSDMASATVVDDAIRGALADALPFAIDGNDNVGQLIGPYRITRTLGSGGMGVVYLAERADQEFEQEVAIKVVRQRLLDPEVEKRLRGERQILADLKHPNIARLFDGGTMPDGTPYLVMEYVDGLPIDDYCDRNCLTIDERLRLFLDVCAAIQHAHQNLVVHRDIKASNILVTAAGNPVLLDFGIARLLGGEGIAAAGLTRVGSVMMTPENAAPEQVRNQPITTATDTYALGVLLYRLLTGRPPYEIDMNTPADIPRIICEVEPPPPSVRVRQESGDGNSRILWPMERVAEARRTSVEGLCRKLRGDLDNIVNVAMHKEPARRYRTVSDLADDIRRHLGAHPVLARPDTWRYRTSRFLKRHTAGATMAGVLVALLVAFAVTLSVQNRRIAEERDAALEISAFLEDIFREPDPYNARGASISAREILENGATRISTQLGDRPDIQATLMTTIGRVYYNLGEYRQSIQMLEESLKVQQATLGADDPKLARTLDQLGASLVQVADYGRAEELLKRSLRANRSRGGRRSAAVAGNLYHLAELYYESSGATDDAERNARESVDLYRELGDEHALDRAEAQALVSRILQRRNQFEEAEALLKDTIETVRNRQGPDTASLAYYLQNLAVLQRAMGDLAEAETTLHQAIEFTRKVLGDEHSLLGGSQVMLGTLLHERGEFEAAETALRDALRVHRLARGDAHPFVGYDLVSLGILLHDTGRLEEAESSLKSALDIYEQSLDENHQYIASALTELGAVLTAQQDVAEGEALLERAVAIREREYDRSHPLLASTLAALGHNLATAGRYDEAEPLLLESHATLRERYGDDGRGVQRVTRWLAEMYEQSGRPGDAEPYRAAAAPPPQRK